MKRSPAIATATIALLLVAGRADAAIGDWVDGGKARVRLVAAGIGPDGRLNAGIEIELAPGWKTYWRSPGDSGVAPIIDLSASRNLGAADIAYPVPHRSDDGYSTTNIYEDRVLLPVSAPVADPHGDIELALKLDIGVCEEVCIPDHFEAKLDLAAGAADSAAADILAAARDALPGAPQPGIFTVNKAWRSGGTDKHPVFDLTAVVPDAKNAEVFVEGPSDWFADAPKLVSADGGRAVYRFTFDRLGSKTPIAGVSARVTIVSGNHAIEQMVSLD